MRHLNRLRQKESLYKMWVIIHENVTVRKILRLPLTISVASYPGIPRPVIPECTAASHKPESWNYEPWHYQCKHGRFTFRSSTGKTLLISTANSTRLPGRIFSTLNYQFQTWLLNGNLLRFGNLHVFLWFWVMLRSSWKTKVFTAVCRSWFPLMRLL